MHQNQGMYPTMCCHLTAGGRAMTPPVDADRAACGQSRVGWNPYARDARGQYPKGTVPPPRPAHRTGVTLSSQPFFLGVGAPLAHRV